MTVLKVSQLGKAFRKYRSELERVLSWFGLTATVVKENWVLKDINFSLEEGEALALVGQNGAGKSTLLKLITGTLQPSEGSIVINGRVSAILELGMGFSPELTGRQNATHGLGLMGFSQSKISKIMPGLEAFTEIGEYFDQPVRTYSSGMHMRLAFSVATAFKPHILIVDEALAVGDAYFHHKCLDRIRGFQKSGTNLLMVSHDRAAILALCRRAILIKDGKILKDGAADEVMDLYNAVIAAKEHSNVEQRSITANGKLQTVSGTGEVTVSEIKLFRGEDELTDFVRVGEDLELRVSVRVNQNVETLVFGYAIRDRYGQPIFGTNTWHTKQILNNLAAGDSYRFRIKFLANFGPGSYSVQTALVDQDTHHSANYEWSDNILIFNVVNVDKTYFIGSNWNDPQISIEAIS